jgi:hypothetical protein
MPETHMTIDMLTDEKDTAVERKLIDFKGGNLTSSSL